MLYKQILDKLKLNKQLKHEGKCLGIPYPFERLNEYLISIAWQGVQATGAPSNICGQNAYSNENMRRVVNTVVQIATLAS